MTRQKKEPTEIAFVRMMAEGLPIQEFIPNEETGAFDFVFDRDLSPKEKRIAKQIVKDELGDVWELTYFKGELA